MYEELIQRLENAAGGPEGIKMAHDAAELITALQSENTEKDKEIEKLRMQIRVKDACISGKSSIIARVEAERDALLEYANAQMECGMCKSDTFCPVENPMPENCALCELKPKCPCHPCKWEWRGVQGGGVSMERLTYWNCKEKGSALPVAIDEDGNTVYLETLCARLAAYEDTGLEPDGIDEVLNEAYDLGYQACLNYKGSTWSEATELQAYRTLGPVEELSALVKARDEGWVYIAPPPAKEGDPKPACFYEGGGTIWCLGLAPGGDDEPCDRCKACWYCESGDYADDRAEAEAAVGGGGDG